MREPVIREPASPLLTVVAPPERQPAVEAALAQEPRLRELVAVAAETPAAPSNVVLVGAQDLLTGPDWEETLPPVVLRSVGAPEAGSLLALVFARLGNWEKATAYAAATPALLAEVELLRNLQAGRPLTAPPAPINDVGSLEHYRRWHNRAVALHYGHLRQPADAATLQHAYRQALASAPTPDWQAFSAKHYATFLLDNNLLTEARQHLTDTLARPLSHAAKHELLAVETGVLLQQLTVPYDADLLAELKDKLWQTLQYYEQQHRPLSTALTLLDAAQVANFSDSFAEALGYLNRAIELLSREEAPELLASAQYRKGVLLFTWAQNGNPQFYRGAMTAYQQALQVFTRNEAYEVFAQIQHHLGIIYSEIPDEVRKKSIWAAVSVSSFQQALEYFTPETHPYEYATICNHYANALTKYPPSVKADNFARALTYYRQALAVRTAPAYPVERALTQLNFLEAAWQVDLGKTADPAALLHEMHRYAQEIPHLIHDPALHQAAADHAHRLQQVQLD